MIDPVTGALVGGALNVGGSLLGQWWASADEAEQQALMERAAREYGSVDAPTLERLLAQEAESAVAGAPSEYGNRGARDAALRALMGEGLAGGNSLDAALSQAQAQRSAGQAYQQGSQAALQSAQARGQGGAASRLQAQLLGASTGADRAAQVGLQGASDARRQALQALQTGGSMAGQAEASDAAGDLARRQSLDAMARFNASQREAAARFNAGQQQQEYVNRVGAAERRAGSYDMQAEQRRQEAERKRRMLGGLGQSAGYGLAGAGTYGSKP